MRPPSVVAPGKRRGLGVRRRGKIGAALRTAQYTRAWMRMRPPRVPGLANLLRRFAPLCIGRPKAAPIYSPLGALFGGYVGTQFWGLGRRRCDALH